MGNMHTVNDLLDTRCVNLILEVQEGTFNKLEASRIHIALSKFTFEVRILVQGHYVVIMSLFLF